MGRHVQAKPRALAPLIVFLYICRVNSFEYIISPVAAWFVAQLAKMLIILIRNKTFDLARLTGDGGMPSSHSALVTALSVTCLYCFGFDSIHFAITAVFALVVMHDAAGIRFESGKQAKAINDIHERMQTLLQMPLNERLEEFLGHTPFQVLMGALTGALVSTIVHFAICS